MNSINLTNCNHESKINYKNPIFNYLIIFGILIILISSIAYSASSVNLTNESSNKSKINLNVNGDYIKYKVSLVGFMTNVENAGSFIIKENGVQKGSGITFKIPAYQNSVIYTLDTTELNKRMAPGNLVIDKTYTIEFNINGISSNQINFTIIKPTASPTTPTAPVNPVNPTQPSTQLAAGQINLSVVGSQPITANDKFVFRLEFSNADNYVRTQLANGYGKNVTVVIDGISKPFNGSYTMSGTTQTPAVDLGVIRLNNLGYNINFSNTLTHTLIVNFEIGKNKYSTNQINFTTGGVTQNPTTPTTPVNPTPVTPTPVNPNVTSINFIDYKLNVITEKSSIAGLAEGLTFTDSKTSDISADGKFDISDASVYKETQNPIKYLVVYVPEAIEKKYLSKGTDYFKSRMDLAVLHVIYNKDDYSNFVNKYERLILDYKAGSKSEVDVTNELDKLLDLTRDKDSKPVFTTEEQSDIRNIFKSKDSKTSLISLGEITNFSGDKFSISQLQLPKNIKSTVYIYATQIKNKSYFEAKANDDADFIYRVGFNPFNDSSILKPLRSKYKGCMVFIKSFSPTDYYFKQDCMWYAENQESATAILKLVLKSEPGEFGVPEEEAQPKPEDYDDVEPVEPNAAEDKKNLIPLNLPETKAPRILSIQYRGSNVALIGETYTIKYWQKNAQNPDNKNLVLKIGEFDKTKPLYVYINVVEKYPTDINTSEFSEEIETNVITVNDTALDSPIKKKIKSGILTLDQIVLKEAVTVSKSFFIVIAQDGNPKTSVPYIIIKSVNTLPESTKFDEYEINKRIIKFYCPTCTFPSHPGLKPINFGNNWIDEDRTPTPPIEPPIDASSCPYYEKLIPYFKMLDVSKKPSDDPNYKDSGRVIGSDKDRKFSEIIFRKCNNSCESELNNEVFEKVSTTCNLTIEEKAVFWANICEESGFHQCTGTVCESVGIAQVNLTDWKESSYDGSAGFRSALNRCKITSKADYVNKLKLVESNSESSLLIGASIFIFEREAIKGYAAIDNMDIPFSSKNNAINTAFMTFYNYQQGSGNARPIFEKKGIPSLGGKDPAPYEFVAGGNKATAKLSTFGSVSASRKLGHYLYYLGAR
ncbi:MAG: hypothetical protein V1824_00740 [archaeon]